MKKGFVFGPGEWFPGKMVFAVGYFDGKYFSGFLLPWFQQKQIRVFWTRQN
ncbi:MAG: hypothetical protein WCA44_05795 [Acidobacteriaceae bacterium]